MRTQTALTTTPIFAQPTQDVVVGLGAFREIRPERRDDPDAQSFSVSEYAALDDRRR